MKDRDTNHNEIVPSTLPDPTFLCDGRELVSFSSNNYLGLATNARMKTSAHEALEARRAEIKHKQAAMLFATGYLTNLGVLPTLVKASNLARAFGYKPWANWKHAFFTDEFNHLSIREGIRASGAPAFASKHLDMQDLDDKLKASPAQIKIIATDGVFSQHGDIVPLSDMMELAERHDAVVYIDDAHGTG